MNMDIKETGTSEVPEIRISRDCEPCMCNAFGNLFLLCLASHFFFSAACSPGSHSSSNKNWEMECALNEGQPKKLTWSPTEKIYPGAEANTESHAILHASKYS